MHLRNSLYDVFLESVDRFATHPFLAAPARLATQWNEPTEISYEDALARVNTLREQYMEQGLQEGDRIALAFDSRPEFVFHYLALNGLGVCVVPLNIDLTTSELAYQIGHAACSAVIGLPGLHDKLSDAIAEAGFQVALSTTGVQNLGPLWRPGTYIAPATPVERPAAILYTSGTTGKPKGCVLTNVYLQESAGYNIRLPSHLAFEVGAERMMNPLPLYHLNALVNTLGAAIMTGTCYVIPGRFSATNWWNDIAETKATRFKYLGIMIPALLAQPETERDRLTGIKNAFGAGVDPALHERFEKRFGIPLIEVWGMTETGRILIVDQEPRHIHTRACGRPQPGLEAKIIDEDGQDAPDGEIGELVVRHSAENPRYGFFSCYLNDPEATEAAWKDGWFHSGDLCTRSADGMFTFVDRQKNIIRRSGENISSAEVEAVLVEHPAVKQVAVMAVPDEMRDEEVLACVVLSPSHQPDQASAESLHELTASKLAYYKTPGWVHFMDELPITGTQKIQKHRIYAEGFNPDAPGIFDLRSLKRWKK